MGGEVKTRVDGTDPFEVGRMVIDDIALRAAGYWDNGLVQGG